MFRVLFATYVTAVVLAGPSACCCMAAGVLAGVSAERAEEASQAGRRGGHRCCGRHASHDHGDRPSAPDEERECPCREGNTQVVAETREQVAELQQLRPALPIPLDLPTPGRTAVEADGRPEQAQIGNRASHFGSSREILRALRTYLV